MRLAILLALLATAACARVRAYERGQLARVQRCADREATARGLEAHMWMVREGAAGGYGKPGGGCGCN